MFSGLLEWDLLISPLFGTIVMVIPTKNSTELLFFKIF